MAIRSARKLDSFDRELAELPPEVRWLEWMGRVEAVIFAAAEPVSRQTLSDVVGVACNLDLIIEDIRNELRGRPYELVSVAGGWQHRTKPAFAPAIQAAAGLVPEPAFSLSEHDMAVLATIVYHQTITRAQITEFFGKEVSRDLIARLRSLGLIGSGPRSPRPGAPYSYVTTPAFLSHFGLASLDDLPDL